MQYNSTLVNEWFSDKTFVAFVLTQLRNKFENLATLKKKSKVEKILEVIKQDPRIFTKESV